ncbi:MAG: hypothetical protein CMP51_06125 [Flavobacteriales bacterium]|nr:hypothetical protein [Flavobacteriales bacterium]
MKKIFYILIIFSFFSITAYNQVSINTSGNFSSPTFLIDNVLIGNGVTTSNHSFVGNSSQIGYFTDSLNKIGFSEGFILSTGGVDSIGNTGVDTLPWWNYIFDSLGNIIDSTPVIEGTFLSSSFGGNGDQDLLTIANSVPGLINQTFSVSSTQDAVILEFDFVPSSDTVKFNYVFASEEYLDFVNSSYNDVFAFLISGPGISGPYASPPGFPGGAKNIAIVPSSNPTLPITISTVNDTINSQYYNHDTLGLASAFNGYTDVFTAKSAVIPCNVYHIKLAIADGTDDSYDSGVFFEAGSFDATEPGALNVSSITTDIQCYGDTNGTSILCISGGVAPYSINWNGVNPNNLAAGTYNVDVTDIQGSSGGHIFTILEPSQISINASLNGNQLEASVVGGTPGYLFEWFLNGSIPVSNTAFFTPNQNGIYTIQVTDNNGCIAVSDPINVTNISTGNNSINSNIEIYPNPFSDFTNIIINNHDLEIDFSLYDQTGKKIKNIEITRNHNNSFILNKNNIESGIYILIIESQGYSKRTNIFIY